MSSPAGVVSEVAVLEVITTLSRRPFSAFPKVISDCERA